MLRPGGVARPASARAFTTELARVGSPLPVSVMTGWLIVIYHRRTFTGWTGSLMGCEQRSPRSARSPAESFSFATLGGVLCDLGVKSVCRPLCLRLRHAMSSALKQSPQNTTNLGDSTAKNAEKTGSRPALVGSLKGARLRGRSRGPAARAGFLMAGCVRRSSIAPAAGT
jgi:hypothetical protein